MTGSASTGKRSGGQLPSSWSPPAGLLTKIRARFAQVERDAAGTRRIYFENAGGTLRLKSVLAVVNSLSAVPDNGGRNNPDSRSIDAAIAAGREAAALLLGAQEGRIIADQSTTGLMFRILHAIAAARPRGNFVTTNLEHASAYDATRLLAARYRGECRIAQFDPQTGEVSAAEIARLVDRQTALVTVIHSSNVLGTKNAVTDIVRTVREINPEAFIVVDGAQHCSHGLVDVSRLGADAYLFAPYKMFAKPGISFAHLSPRLGDLPHDKLAGKGPQEWDLGTREPAAYAMLVCLTEYLAWLAAAAGLPFRTRRGAVVAGMQVIERLETELMRTFLHGRGGTPGLLQLPQVIVYGQTDRLADREAIFAFSIQREPKTSAIVAHCAARGIRLHNRVRDAFSGHTLAALGIEECVRVSACHYNTPAEVLRFLEAAAELTGR